MNLSKLYYKTIEFLGHRKQSYQLAFGSPAGQSVLHDLARFCRATETCFDRDPRLHAVLEGRREVFLRIQQHLGMTVDELYALYNRNAPVITRAQATEEDEDNG